MENFIFSYKGSLAYVDFNFICSKLILKEKKKSSFKQK